MGKFGVKDVNNCTFYNITTGKPVAYLNTLKMSTVSVEGEQVFATGGQGNPRLIGWDHSRTVTFNLQDALLDLTFLGKQVGTDTVTGATTIHQRDKLTADASNQVTLSQIPLASTTTIFKDNVDGTEQAAISNNPNGVKATGRLTFTGVVANAQTVTIGADVYEFDTGDGVVGGNIAVDISSGVTADIAVAQLRISINASAVETVTAVGDTVSDTVVVTYDTVGVAGNAIATTETCVNASWGAANLTGGVAAVAASYLFGDINVYSGGGTTRTARKITKYDMNQIENTAGYGGDIRTIWGDETHIYVGGMTTNTVRKYLKSNMSYVTVSPDYGGNIISIWGDDTYIYVGGGTTNRVRKYLKSDLSYVSQAPSYGGIIWSIWGDETHIYAGGDTTETVRKYLKLDMSLVDESASYGGTITSVWGDGTHVYLGGVTTQTVRKLLKSDMSLVATSADYGGTVFAIWGDSTHLFIGGATTQTVRKLLKSDMSLVTASADYSGVINAIWGDSTHIYLGGSTQVVRKLLKSNMSFVADSEDYGGTIYTIWDSATLVTFNASSVAEADTVVVYYQFTSEAIAELITLNSNTFPGYFKIIGDTVIRNNYSKTDENFQIVIERAKLGSNFSLAIEASGDPSPIDIPIEVVKPSNGTEMIKFIKY